MLSLMLLISTISWGQTKLWLKWESSDSSYRQNWKEFPNELEREQELDSILADFFSKGYLSAYWDFSTQRIDSLSARLNLGAKFILKEIGKGNLPEELVVEYGLPESGFMAWNQWSKTILRELENKGYPFASLKLDSLMREGEIIYASTNLDPGPLIRWDTVQVLGSTKTKAKYLQNLTRIPVGGFFSQEEFENASQVLSRSPYFELSQSPELAFRTQKASPIFYLRDRNVNVMDGVIGLLPNENEPGKVLVTGQLDLELYHLGGKGRNIAVHWQRMNKETQSLNLSARESFLFNSPLHISLAFNLLKQDSTFLNRYFGIDFDYQISNKSTIQFFTKRQASDLISTVAYQDVEELPDLADFRWNVYGIGVDYNGLDRLFSPRKGIWLQAEFAAGNKRIIQNTGIPEEAYQNIDLNTPQLVATIQLEKHLYIKKSWGMWFRGSSGFVRNKSLFINDLFRLGGLKTIRGFNENFFYAKNYGYLNMEQRLFFGEDSYLMIFTDVGFLKNPILEKEDDFPVSFGAGINLETGNGVFRFIYGLGKSNLQPLSFSYSKIHFGYLARF
ncbi:Surface antigen [Algoriphagus halophilus]|uniref:Surface antigen n=2 Tax=Algoriphagus halophilus TaxID=226505 RepID=A0A1N6HRH2_9BACT|nr:Surface antigen [Algoriphagus halophilus]